MHRRLSRMRRAVLSAGTTHRDACPAPGWLCIFITLTYRPGVPWHRKHISGFLKGVRKQTRQPQLRYVWVLELTRAGRPHYHVAIWLPKGTWLPKPDDSRTWIHGMSRVELARHPVGYLLKYATKGTDGQRLPRGARLYGAGGLGREGRSVLRWWLLPRYVREYGVEVGDHVVRCRGGGWVSMSTGEWWPSVPYPGTGPPEGGA